MEQDPNKVLWKDNIKDAKLVVIHLEARQINY